jgi:radical SAM superfamily enzyme YgiQ (UPF0313 family)
MEHRAEVLLINPWIYDFAAFNLWIEPLGLLTVAAALRSSGYGVSVIDCLAPFPGAPRSRTNGAGKLYKVAVDKPAPVVMVPRHYGRYGMPLDLFERALTAAPVPDVVMVASGMTYWYPGVVEAIRRVRARFGSVPVVLGGVYATLCSEHARCHSGADEVVSGPGVAAALRFAARVTGRDCRAEWADDPRSQPEPDHALIARPYAAVVTSWGCPYECTYCASRRLQPTYSRRQPAAVVAEIAACYRRGIRDFAFYDDALLVDADRHLAPVLEGVLSGGIEARFHTPNGLHARHITADLARLMRRSGFVTIRLSLETMDAWRQQATGAKVTSAAFEEAVAHLRSVGFGSSELGAYILAGLPGQPLDEVEDTVRFVHGLGVQAKLALYAPVPGTPDGDRALPPGADPLLHNNTAYPYLRGEEYVRRLQQIKDLAKRGPMASV